MKWKYWKVLDISRVGGRLKNNEEEARRIGLKAIATENERSHGEGETRACKPCVYYPEGTRGVIIFTWADKVLCCCLETCEQRGAIGRPSCLI